MKKYIIALLTLMSFNITANSQCDGSATFTYIDCDSVWFVPTSTGPQYAYFWDFGDGNSSTEASPTNTYAANGTYTVLFSLTDSLLGCTDITTYIVNVNCSAFPCTLNGAIAYFLDTNDCSVNFVSTAFSGSPPYTYFWNFDDGTTSSNPNPTHTYPNGSIWYPCLTITDANGCDTTICDTVAVSCVASSCDATFLSSYVTCDSVWFIPNSTGSQYTYFWDYGDGATSTFTNPAHQYASDGTYIVILTLTDSLAGCIDLYTLTVDINCGTTPCTVNGAMSAYVDSVDCSVNFISTAFGGTMPYSYLWLFGDGTTSIDANPVHNFPSMGAWSYCLTITDAGGCDTTFCDTLMVNCAPPICNAEYTISYITCDSVWFIPASSGPQYDYYWEFGDGATSTEISPAHQYAGDGTYISTLIIIDSLAMCSNIYTFIVEVNCGATPCSVVGDFAWNIDSTSCEVNFVSTAFGGVAPYTYYWDFGDGTSSADPSPSHLYSGGPTFLPCLTITDASGCDTTICQIIIVDCIPSSCNADFSFTFIACDSVWFIPVSSGSQYSYFWDFGDGATSTATNPAHQYASDGTYYVILSLTDSSAGCYDVLTVPVTINCGFSPCSVSGAFAYFPDSITCEVNFISTAFGGTVPYTYYWQFGDGTSSANPNPAHLYIGGPTFTPCVTITDANGCDTTICDIIIAECASMNIIEVENESTLLIFPNPAKDFFNIQVENLEKVEIYDISGKLIWSESYSNSFATVNIDLSNIVVGTYIIVVSTAEKTFSRQLVKF